MEHPVHIDTTHTHTNYRNTVTIIGTLGNVNRRTMAPGVIRPTYNGVGGRLAILQLQVAAPLASSFSLRLELPPSTAGLPTITPDLPVGTPVEVTGYLQTEKDFDRRYAVGLEDPGLRTLSTQVRASAITVLPALERLPHAEVQLLGTVLAHPWPLHHPEYPDRPLARVELLVMTPDPSGLPGMPVVLQPVVVEVIIPLAHPDAALLFQPNNVVAVAGVLDRLPLPRLGEQANALRADLRKQWAELAAAEAAAAVALPPPVPAQRQRDLRRTFQAVDQEIRLFVLAATVELHAGTPRSWEESRRLIAQTWRHDLTSYQRRLQRQAQVRAAAAHLVNPLQPVLPPPAATTAGSALEDAPPVREPHQAPDAKA